MWLNCNPQFFITNREIEAYQNTITFRKDRRLLQASLKSAIELGDLEACTILTADDVDFDSGFPGCNWCTPLLLALMTSKVDIAHLLISRGASIAGAACREAQFQGFTPFHCAALFRDSKMMHLLLERSCHLLSCCCQPVHPIHLAVASGDIRCVELIIDYTRKGGIHCHSYLCNI